MLYLTPVVADLQGDIDSIVDQELMDVPQAAHLWVELEFLLWAFYSFNLLALVICIRIITILESSQQLEQPKLFFLQILFLLHSRFHMEDLRARQND